MQRPPQAYSPEGHEVTQAPPVQTVPDAQTVPPEHAASTPQKARSVAGSTQRPLQLTSPAWHDSAHVPALQA